jgi:hypothetical protein
MSPKLRVVALMAALASTGIAVYWANSLTDTQEAGAGAVVAPVARNTHSAQGNQGNTQSNQGITPVKLEPAVAQGTPPTSTKETPGSSAGALDLRKLQRPRSAGPTGEIFGPRDFRPEPPLPKRAIAQPGAAALQAAPPPPPSAPPLPFAYMGKLDESGATIVFLAMGERNLVVKPGDVIDNMYRLDQVSDNAVMLTHLPTGMQQSLPIGVQ